MLLLPQKLIIQLCLIVGLQKRLKGGLLLEVIDPQVQG